MSYTFEEGLNGFIGAGEEIFNQKWIHITQTIKPLQEILDNLKFSETAPTYDEYKEKIEESSKLIEEQGVFYTKPNGDPNNNGETMKKNMEEIADYVEDYKNKVEEMDVKILEDAIKKYNDNLEKAMANAYKNYLRKVCNEYNGKKVIGGYEEQPIIGNNGEIAFDMDGNIITERKYYYDKINYEPLLQEEWTTFDQIKNSKIMQEIAKSPRNEYINVMSLVRPSGTEKESE